MRRTLVLVILGLLAAGGVDAQDRPRRTRDQMQEQRQQRERQMEQAIRQRFLAAAAERMQLEDDQRERLREVIREGSGERLELARQSRELRVLLMEAVKDEGTTPETYESLLRQIRELREREHALEQQELNRLAEFLDARQQAMFMVLRMRFNDQVRQLRGGGRGGPGASRGGPAAGGTGPGG